MEFFVRHGTAFVIAVAVGLWYGRQQDSVVIGSGEHGRGLFATSEMRRGELLYAIPKDLWISVSTLTALSEIKPVLMDDQLRSAVEGGGTSELYVLLTIGLLYEQNVADSHWQLYLESLPSFDIGMATTLWTPDMLVELQSPAVARALGTRNAMLTKTFATIAPLLAERHAKAWSTMAATADKFLFYFFLVMSRAFDCGDEPCLIPIADLANHGFTVEPSNGLKVFENTTYFVAWAPYDLSEGDEVLQSYASANTSTTHYLKTYGFVNNDLHDGQGDYIAIRGGVNATIDRFGRVYATKSLDQKSETRIRAAVAAVKFPTTVAEDMALLEQSLPPWLVSAVLFRLRCKLTLDQLVEAPFVHWGERLFESMYEVAI